LLIHAKDAPEAVAFSDKFAKVEELGLAKSDSCPNIE
jgi:hypothetical protein